MSVEMLGQSPIASDRQPGRFLQQRVPVTLSLFPAGCPLMKMVRFVVGGIEAQTRQVFRNIEKVLALADCTLADICKIGVWLDDARDFGSFNRVPAGVSRNISSGTIDR